MAWLCGLLGGLLLLVVISRALAVGRASGLATYEELGRWTLERRAKLVAGAGWHDEPLEATGHQAATGVAVVWTSEPQVYGSSHHLSFSLHGGRIPLGLGLPLLAFVARRAGLPLDRLRPALVGDSGVLHAVAELDRDAHKAWLDAAPAAGDLEAEVAAARAELEGLRGRLERVEPPAQA